MPKICVQSPEVVSQGEIKIHARVNVTTKAKLDEITVQGACACDGPPIIPTQITDMDIVFLVDGSDSFETTKIDKLVVDASSKGSNTQFSESMAWCADFIANEEKGLTANRDGRTTVTVVQFSGIKSLESQYDPERGDGNAFADNDELKHYKVEYGPIMFDRDDGKISELQNVDALDGNSQLYLALQDMSSDKFIQQLNEVLPPGEENHVRRRVLIVITDEEWNVQNLRLSSSLNSSVSAESDLNVSVEDQEAIDDYNQEGRIRRQSRRIVPNYAGNVYNDMFAIIVRPNENMPHLNEDFIKNSLCKGAADHYFKVYANNFHEGMAEAKKKIARHIARY